MQFGNYKTHYPFSSYVLNSTTTALLQELLKPLIPQENWYAIE